MLGFGKCIRLAHYKLLTLDDNYFFMNRKKNNRTMQFALIFPHHTSFCTFYSKKTKIK